MAARSDHTSTQGDGRANVGGAGARPVVILLSLETDRRAGPVGWSA